MKHVKAPPTKWRLKKTLARAADFRPIEQEDLRHIWAAYGKGALASMGGEWGKGDLPAVDFIAAFTKEIEDNYHAAWTLFAQTRKGLRPIGLVLGFWSHPNPQFAPFMIVGDMIWFPWSSPRNRIEAAVQFFHRIRSEIALVEYARDEHKRFFEMICHHGIMRRIGTTYNVYPGEGVAVYETRTP